MAELEDAKKRITVLEAQVKTETEAKAAALKQVESLTKEKSDVLKQVEALTKEKAEAVSQLEVAGKVVLDLKTQLAEKQAGTVELPTVTLGKETYELVGGDFMYAGREVTLDVLKEDPKLVAELVKEKVSHLRLVVKK